MQASIVQGLTAERNSRHAHLLTVNRGSTIHPLFLTLFSNAPVWGGMVISPFLPWGAGLSDLSTVTQYFIIFLAAVHGMWDLSSPTRGQTHAPCSRSAKS